MDLKKFLLQLDKRITKMKYEQVILGDERHPRRVRKHFEIPEYIRNYNEINDIFEIACCVAGNSVMSLNRKSFLLKNGDICFVKHDVKHFESYFRQNMMYEMVWIMYPNIQKIRIAHFRYDPVEGHKILSSLTVRVKPESVFILEDMFQIKNPKKNFSEIRDIIKKWFSLVNNNIKKGNYENKEFTEKYIRETIMKERRLQKANDYIKNHFTENITLNDVAAQVSLNPVYLSSVYKEVHNISVYQYVTYLRLKEAYILLRTTGLNIDEIGFKVGYSDPLFFRRIFKKYTGITPKSFRMRSMEPDGVLSLMLKR